MIVACPRCAARYALPERLLGTSGARVRCPRCDESFVVERRDPGASPEQGLDALEASAGPMLGPAHARGALFAEHGAEVCSAFDAYAAAGGGATEFRAGFERRFGIRLVEGRSQAQADPPGGAP